VTDHCIGGHIRRNLRLQDESPGVPELIIFDCDGVLVDSELIFARILAECLVAVDFPTTIDEAITLGFGKNRTTLSEAVEVWFGRALPDTFFDTFAVRSATAFEHELSPMAGVTDLLAALPTPRCVASNGRLDRVRQRLTVTRLLPFFDPHVFSASQVAHGKPAPDLFLFAAYRLGAAPGDCIVVEDSIPGVEAAVAAGMPVVGFCGGGHCPDGHAERLGAAGCVRVFARMPDLAAYLREEPCG
jgi:HAD superfamily hydrolase (TIGR01509 family)